MDRNLGFVMDEIVALAPEIKEPFNDIASSIPYTAPEAMYLRWQEIAAVLEEHVKEGHPNFQKIVNIFNGKTQPPAEG